MGNNRINKEALLKSCIELKDLAERMQVSCNLKRYKVHSHTRYILSFFLRRSLQMMESFLLLINNSYFIDCVLLLRSFCDMNVTLEWILAEEEMKEINSLKLILKGEKDHLDLLKNNYDIIKKKENSIDEQIAKIKSNIKNIESDLTNKYNAKKWGVPPLKNRAEKAGKVILNYFTQIYGNYSNIEHHSLIFGQYYIDWAKCEPRGDLKVIEDFYFFKPKLLLYLFRGLFLQILSKFNKEFNLNYSDIISKCLSLHIRESNNL